MRYRRFGRLGWDVSEIGYGMWGIAGGTGGWSGADDVSGHAALDEALSLGCNFFDTAWIYGRGHSERMLGELLMRRGHDSRPNVATKFPPKDRNWPSMRGSLLSEVFPADHMWEYLERSRTNLGVDTIDLLQFHVWEDAWATDPAWQDPVAEMKSRGLVRGIGISVNRWEPWNVRDSLATVLIASVQAVPRSWHGSCPRV